MIVSRFPVGISGSENALGDLLKRKSGKPGEGACDVRVAQFAITRVEDFRQAVGYDCQNIAGLKIDAARFVLYVRKHCEREVLNGMPDNGAVFPLEVK